MTEAKNDVCIVCRKDCDDELVIFCDGCDKAFHTYCINGCLCCKKKPNNFGRAIEVPEGDFFCKMCKGHIPAVPDDDQKQVYTLAYSFGLNEAGQLGLGDEGRDKNRKVPTLIHDLKGVGVVQASLGGWNTTVLTHEGSVYTCGDGNSGKTGHADVIHEYLPRFRVIEKLEPDARAQLDGDIKHLASGQCYSAAVVEGGGIYTWGQGDNGTLGHQAFTDKKTPSKISALIELEFTVKSLVACGHTHMMAVTSDAGIVGDEILMSWGNGKLGQLGRGDLADKWVPQLLNPENTYDLGESYYTKASEDWEMGPIKKIIAGKNHSVALTKSGQVWSWGAAAMGQLGHGQSQTSSTNDFFSRNYVNVLRPKQVSTLADVNISNIFCGADHCFALSDKHEVYAWGRNSFGQCGTGSGPSNVWLPTKVAGLSPATIGANVVDIACGDNHSIALTDKCTIFVFGCGSSGQLGTGQGISLEEPTLLDFKPDEEVSVSPGKVAVYAGGDHSMIVYPTTNTPPKVVRKRKAEEEKKAGGNKKAKKGSAKQPAKKKSGTKKKASKDSDSDDEPVTKTKGKKGKAKAKPASKKGKKK